jgi:hypothetical protein
MRLNPSMAKKQDERPNAGGRREGDEKRPPGAGENARPQPALPERKKGSREARATGGKSRGGKREATPTSADERETAGSPQGEKPPETAKAQRIRRRLRKRVSLAEALRREGLDERTVAESYVLVVENLRNGEGKGTPAQKALAQVLKECSRILEQHRGTKSGSGNMPAVVNLHHNVPRPVRDKGQGNSDADSGPDSANPL